MHNRALLHKVLYAGLLLLLLFVVAQIFKSGHTAFAVVALIIASAMAMVYGKKRLYTFRYLFPSLFAFGTSTFQFYPFDVT